MVAVGVVVAGDPTRGKDIKINYGGGGSGKGRQDLADMVTDFAGSDSPFKDADLAKVKGGDVLYFPVLPRRPRDVAPLGQCCGMTPEAPDPTSCQAGSMEGNVQEPSRTSGRGR